MQRALWIAGVTSLLTAVGAAFPLVANAVIGDSTLCYGTGTECVVSSHFPPILDPAGIDVRPLTLHITSTGRITAAGDPRTPLTIKAGAIIIDKSGSILGNVGADKGNSITLLADSLTINGTIDVSSV